MIVMGCPLLKVIGALGAAALSRRSPRSRVDLTLHSLRFFAAFILAGDPRFAVRVPDLARDRGAGFWRG